MLNGTIIQVPKPKTSEKAIGFIILNIRPSSECSKLKNRIPLIPISRKASIQINDKNLRFSWQ